MAWENFQAWQKNASVLPPSLPPPLSAFCTFVCLFVFIYFLGLHLWHMEIPKLLGHQCQILNPPCGLGIELVPLPDH